MQQYTDSYFYLRPSLLSGTQDTYPQRTTRQLAEARSSARKLHQLTGCAVEIVRHTDIYGANRSSTEDVVFSIPA